SHPGNDTAVDPMKWLKSLKGGGGKVGGSGYENAKRAILRAQSILGGRYRSDYITTQMLRVAKRESNYQADAINNWDSNARAGTPSKGMFQMIEPSFRAFAKPGHGNIYNPTDEAISAMKYIVAKYGW
ncbi:transglycosylase SLT domain-containing protein, partial [Staphylococcus aureus]|nr:transglycosylase SLT domain-containing protein [Staphylococcus aureus]